MESEDPKSIKNIIRKKSRSGFTLPEIWILYGEDATATPAKKAPIATEKPICSATAESKNAQAIAATNKSSTETEAILNKLISPNLTAAQVKPARTAPFKSIKTRPAADGTCPPPNPDKTISAKIATKSCTSKNPTVILP